MISNLYSKWRSLDFFFLSVICSLILSSVTSAKTVNKQTVHNQEEFDKIVHRINAGEICNVILKKGRYVLNESMKPMAPISIEGNDAFITHYTSQYIVANADSTSNGFYIYRIDSDINHFSLFLDSQDNILPISESISEGYDVNIIDKPILGDGTHDVGTKIQIPIADGIRRLQNKVFERAYGYLDCGWSRVNFSVDTSDSDYFYCTVLESTNVPSFNYDKNVYDKDLRYVIFNAEKIQNKIYFDSKFLYVPKSNTVVRCLNCSVYPQEVFSIKTNFQIRLKGINFVNFSGIKIQSDEFDSSEISNCSFKNTLGYTLYITKDRTKNKPFIINNCYFNDCSLLTRNIIYLSGSIQGEKSCIYLTSSDVCRYSSDKIMYKNCNSSIYVDGDVTIKLNKIYNTCRSHLFLNRGNIIVNENTIYNTNRFNSFPFRNLSNDFGLIYCNHIFKDSDRAINSNKSSILLSNNFLYGSYAFSGDARGIFIDDGRGDVHCKKNLILDTQSYSIDSRVVPHFIGTSSIRNIFENNFVTRSYRLQAGKDVPPKDKPIIVKNYLLFSSCIDTLNVMVLEKDEGVPIKTNLKITDGTLKISNREYKLLKKVCELSLLRKCVNIIKE